MLAIQQSDELWYWKLAGVRRKAARKVIDRNLLNYIKEWRITKAELLRLEEIGRADRLRELQEANKRAEEDRLRREAEE